MQGFQVSQHELRTFRTFLSPQTTYLSRKPYYDFLTSLCRSLKLYCRNLIKKPRAYNPKIVGFIGLLHHYSTPTVDPL